MMGNRQINVLLKSFDKDRRVWIDMLSKSPSYSEAAQRILSINSKMELLRTFWDWSDETVEMAVL